MTAIRSLLGFELAIVQLLPPTNDDLTHSIIASTSILYIVHWFISRFRSLVESAQQQFPDLEIDIKAELDKYKKYREELRPMV